MSRAKARDWRASSLPRVHGAGRTFFRVSAFGFRSRVQGFGFSGSRFQVSDSKLSVLGNSNHLLRTLISFKESSNHCESMVRVTQTIITKLFIYLTISCFRHNKLLEYIYAAFPLLAYVLSGCYFSIYKLHHS